MQYTTCAPFYLAQPSVEAIEKLFDQKSDDGLTPAERVPGVANHIGRTGERGFTIVELIVVVTVISILSALAAGAYNKVVNAPSWRTPAHLSRRLRLPKPHS